ncbi:MAG TPA: SPOR domain-containing protein [Candidatus Acidoferrales bacterium]|jgi:cell division septation protein DedD|nr:SPOR domain-containing protein [Candidatus Acidoferrales bacterium]
MASRKSGGDFILESRHLVGLFVLLVVIFGVVFTLGYLLGRGQYDSKVRAAVGTPAGFDEAVSPPAKSGAKPESEDAQVQKKSSEWDFYHSADPQAAADHLQPMPKAVVPTPVAKSNKPAHGASKNVTPTKSASGTDSPLIPRGAIMLQVAAVMHQDDALALAQALQQKKFPAYVIPPGADKLYRVQVGPYPDNKAAGSARQDLEAKGFKSIIKR